MFLFFKIGKYICPVLQNEKNQMVNRVLISFNISRTYVLQKWHNLNKFFGKSRNYLKDYRKLFNKHIMFVEKEKESKEHS